MKEKDVYLKIMHKYPDEVSDSYPLPKCFKPENSKIKAIVLGCDPTTSDNIIFDTVFDLRGKDTRYFSKIETNLRCINLSHNDTYVQNLCRNYLKKETSAYPRKEWKEFACEWVDMLKQDLNKIDPACDIPVLLTAEYLIDPLAVKEYKIKNAEYYYNNCELIEKEQNKLNRVLVPFFRHKKYKLTSDDEVNKRYKDYLISRFKF